MRQGYKFFPTGPSLERSFKWQTRSKAKARIRTRKRRKRKKSPRQSKIPSPKSFRDLGEAF
jgi:hypothetical protein